MTLKYKNGELLRRSKKCINALFNPEKGILEKHEVITVLHSKKHKGAYEIKEFLDAGLGEMGLRDIFVEDETYFKSATITNWKQVLGATK